MFNLLLPYLPVTLRKLHISNKTLTIRPTSIPLSPFSFAKRAERKTLWVMKEYPRWPLTFYIREEEKEQRDLSPEFSSTPPQPLSHLSFYLSTGWTPTSLSHILLQLGWSIPPSLCEYMYHRLLLHTLIHHREDHDTPF